VSVSSRWRLAESSSGPAVPAEVTAAIPP
jgi:hypothetical protein